MRRLVTAALAAGLLAIAPLAATSADPPQPGRFTGGHDLRGTIVLTFSTEDIGLHLARIDIRAQVDCEGEVIPMARSGRVTARTAAKVRKRAFVYKAADFEVTGRYVLPRIIEGRITAKNSACTRSGAFRVVKR